MQAVHARPGDRAGRGAGAEGDPRARHRRSTTLCAAFPSVTPVCATSIATGVAAGPPPDRGDELVEARRAPLRRVRQLVPRGPQARHRPAADRHGVQPQRQPPGRRRADGLRVARRRRRPDGGHDLPRLPRPPRAPRLARDRADPPGRPAVPQAGPRPARAVLRRHLRQPRDRLPQPDGPAGHPRPALGLRRRVAGGARPIRLPAAVAARQRHALAQERPARPAGRRSRRPTGRSCASPRPPAGWSASSTPTR